MAVAQPSSSHSVSNRLKDLTCAVCYDIFKSVPKILPCFHSFCLPCLEGLAKYNAFFTCPTCRTPIGVPVGGVDKFQTNIYISERDLEKARKGVDSHICPIHELYEEPLTYFCVPCDETICTRCKLTKHETHKTEDLTETAAERKRRLCEIEPLFNQAVKRQKKIVLNARNNVDAAETKKISLKEQAKAQRDVIIEAAKEQYRKVKKEISTITSDITDDLKSAAEEAERKLQDVEKKQQQVRYAVSNGTGVDVIRLEREFRESNVTEEVLADASCSREKQTVRPGLNSKVRYLPAGCIAWFIGRPTKLTIPDVDETECISEVFNCDEDEFREVRSIAFSSDTVRVSLGSSAPGNDKEQHTDYSLTQCELKWLEEKKERMTYQQYQTDKFFRSSVNLGDGKTIRLNSKSTRKLQVKTFSSSECWIMKMAVSTSPFAVRANGLSHLGKVHAVLHAFDGSSDEQKFVLVQSDAEAEQKRTGTRKVKLYQRDRSNPVAVYEPPASDLPFTPTDVCFWPPGPDQEEKLLVADYANDCVHVVDVEHEDLRFQRYLAPGCGCLVKPTAFNIDSKGVLWIGCGNGSVLTCEPRGDKSEGL